MSAQEGTLRGPVNVRKLQEYNELLIAENSSLRARVHLLTQTIASALGYWPLELPPSLDLVVPREPAESWADKSKHLQGIKSSVLRVAVDLMRREKGPVDYNQIERSFRQRFPDTSRVTHSLAETISRRVRELVEEDYLVRVSEGHFFIGPKVAAGEVNIEQAV